MNFPLSRSELETRTRAVTELARGAEKLITTFVANLNGKDNTANTALSHESATANVPTPPQEAVLAVVPVLERLQVQLEAALHTAASVALSVEAEEQEHLLETPLIPGKGRERSKYGSAFTLHTPATVGSSSAPQSRVNTTNVNADTGAANASSSWGSVFFPDTGTGSATEDRPAQGPQGVWCGVSMKAMDEAVWCLGTELALLWDRSENVTIGMLITSASLSRLPMLETRFQAGLLSARLVKVAVTYCEGLTDAQATAYDQRIHEYLFPTKYDLVGRYPVRSARDLAKMADVTRDRLHAQRLSQRRAKDMKHRFVTIQNELNGMCSLNGLLPAESAHQIMNTITDFAITARTDGDTRTLRQTIADVFCDLITHNYNHSYPNTPADPAKPQVPGRVNASPTSESCSEPPAAPAETPVPEETYAPWDGQGDNQRTSAPEPGAQPRSAENDRPPDQRRSAPSDTAPTFELPYQAAHEAFGDAHTRTESSLGTPHRDSKSATAGTGVTKAESSRSGLRGEAKIFVTIPATTLAGLDDKPGMLSGYGPIPAETIRKLAAEAPTLYRILTDPTTGEPLALGRTSYRISPQLRDFLHLRSDTCQFPGCSVSARRTDADHIQEWAGSTSETGGETNPENLQLLCRKHHNMKTHGGWQALALPEGTIQWTSPLGNIYLTTPTGIHNLPAIEEGNTKERSDRLESGANSYCHKCWRHECSAPGHDNHIGPLTENTFSYEHLIQAGLAPIQGPINIPEPRADMYAADMYATAKAPTKTRMPAQLTF